jgi:2-iminobutanoate/2-iminopropanoate deaminase
MLKKILTLAAIVLTTTLSYAQNNPVPYSKAVEANGFLFVAGHLGTKDGRLVTESFEAEVHQSMKNIQQVLAEYKLTFDDVVTATVYLKDMGNYDKMNDVYRTYFKTRYPARTCIAVAALPRNGNVEITVTAEMKSDKD